MSQQNPGPSSSTPSEHHMKRKRGRPRKDNNLSQQDKTPPTPKPDKTTNNTAATSDNMVGQVVSGVIDGSFDAGYFLNVKVGGADEQLRGVVFLPGRVAPITAINDVAPHAKVFKREEVPMACLNKQTHLHGCVSETNDCSDKLSKLSDQTNVSELCSGMVVTDKNQSVPGATSFSDKHPRKDMGLVSKLHSGISVAEKNESESGMIFLPNSMQNTETGTSSEKIPSMQIPNSGQESQSPSRMPQAENNKVTEASKEIKLSVAQFVDFFPSPERANIHRQAEVREMSCNSNPNPKFFQIQNKVSETEENNHTVFAQNLGMNLLIEKPASPIEALPQNLQLGLGNRIVRADNTSRLDGGSQNNITEANSQSSSMSGFLANLFEGDAVVNEPRPAVSESGLQCSDVPQMSSSPVVAYKNNENVDSNLADVVHPVQSQNQIVLN